MSEDVPLPKVNQRYKDDHGGVCHRETSVEENLVVFMREGYPHPLHATDVQLRGKFQTRSREETE